MHRYNPEQRAYFRSVGMTIRRCECGYEMASAWVMANHLRYHGHALAS